MNLTSTNEFFSKKAAFRLSKLLSITVLLLLPIVMSTCDESDDYELYSTIAGSVIDYDTADPITDAIVTLSPGGLTTSTDAAGNFSFSNLDPQQYTLIIQKNGYQPNRKIINAVSGEETPVIITLARIPQ